LIINILLKWHEVSIFLQKLLIMRIFAFGIFFILTLVACQTSDLNLSAITDNQAANKMKYQAADIQKMQWLAGAWKSKTISHLLCQFHHTQALEIMDLGGTACPIAGWLKWQNERYYFGNQNQWVVSWIGEKDIRFDAVTAGAVPAMTWVRHTSDKWLLIRHLKTGDEVTIMEAMQQTGLGIVP
jgi:hypothetical protein